jgi:hypothetical protein
MSNQAIAMSPRRDARIAGMWYAILAALSVFGMLFVDARLYVPGDAAATASRILADQWVYRLGIASTLAGQVCQVFVGLAFYRLFLILLGDSAYMKAFAAKTWDIHRRGLLGLVAPAVGLARVQVGPIPESLWHPALYQLRGLRRGLGSRQF